MTEQNVENLTINYLTEDQYNITKEAGNINENELYMTPDDSLNNSSNISLLDVYPVGSIYMSVSPTDPSILFGGTWEVWGAGRVPVCVDTTQLEFNDVEETGGSKYMQKHNHKMQFTLIGTGGGVNNVYGMSFGGTNANGGEYTSTAPSNSGETRMGVYDAGTGNAENLPPYITCYMWKRTA